MLDLFNTSLACRTQISLLSDPLVDALIAKLVIAAVQASFLVLFNLLEANCANRL